MTEKFKKREYKTVDRSVGFNLNSNSDDDRKIKIILELEKSDRPISATRLADKFGVSRQIIVGDIALLRAAGAKIVSTNRGYILERNNKTSITRIFKVKHSSDIMKDELYAFVDSGGTVLDVFVDHGVYGRISAIIDVSSRKDVEDFIKKMESSKTSSLSNLTDGIHYHTVEFEDISSCEYTIEKLKEIDILLEVIEDYVY